jgi:hypothetical protein
MICPSCKNPIEENKHICEWCGHLLNNDKPIENSPIQPFENELLSLIKAGKREKAIKLYSKYTSKDLSTASRAIKKLIVDSGLSIVEIEKKEKRSIIKTVVIFIFIPVIYLLFMMFLGSRSLIYTDPKNGGTIQFLMIYIIGVIIYLTIKRKNNKIINT